MARQKATFNHGLLWPRGIFEASPDALRFGSAVFYSRFFQHGTKRHAARRLIHVDEHGGQLASWLQRRAASAGLEVT